LKLQRENELDAIKYLHSTRVELTTVILLIDIQLQLYSKRVDTACQCGRRIGFVKWMRHN